MSKYNRWDIWYAKVKFEDSNEVKNRPVLIYNNAAYIIAYKMTSVDRGDNSSYFKITHWKEAGLTKPTSVRIEKLLKLHDSDMIRRIGSLDERDQLLFEMRLTKNINK